MTQRNKRHLWSLYRDGGACRKMVLQLFAAFELDAAFSGWTHFVTPETRWCAKRDGTTLGMMVLCTCTAIPKDCQTLLHEGSHTERLSGETGRQMVGR